MSSLDRMHQELIMDHARRRSGEGLAEPAPEHVVGEAHQYNPTCGDEITVRVELGAEAPEPVVRRITWNGQGCSLSTAAASVLVETATGSTRTEVLALIAAFRELLTSRGAAEADEELLGDALAFGGVSRLPVRVRCGMLGWVAAEQAIAAASGDEDEGLLPHAD